jgi:hypothetical protein
MRNVDGSLDWIGSAITQIGRFVAKNYSCLSSAFDTISELKSKMGKQQLLGWLNSNLVLQGFNLTKDMEQTLYAYFDSHSKGYIVESDFVGKLQEDFLNREQDSKKVESALFSNLESSSRIWKTLTKSSHAKQVDRPSFLKTMTYLTRKDYDNVWQGVCRRTGKPFATAEFTKKEFESEFLKETGSEPEDRN